MLELINKEARGNFMMLDKKNRIYNGATAIVTGGASGIGKALSQELARRGCEVVLADIQIDEAKHAATEIRAWGGKAKAIMLNVTDFPSVKKAVQETYTLTGRLDYIFNNAGIVIGGTADNFSIEDWNKIIDINFRGVVNGIQAAYPLMIAQGFGHIVSTASMAGLIPNPLNAAYAATKHAVVGLSQSLRIEAAYLGVRVSVICPGVVRTPILRGGEYGAVKTKIPQEKLDEMWEELKPMDPVLFAKKVLNDLAKNKAMIIYPAWWKMLWFLNRFSFNMGSAFMNYRFGRINKEYDIYK